MSTVLKKEISLVAFMTIVSAALFWFLTSPIVPLYHPAVLIILLFVVAAWLACLAVTLAFTSGINSTVTMITLTLLLIIFGRANLYILGAAVIFVALLAIARFFIKRDLNSYIRYRTKQSFYAGVKNLLMATVVLAAGISAPHVAQGLATDNLILPEETVRLLIRPFEPYWQQNLPGYSSGMTVDELIDSQLQDELTGSPQQVALQKEFIQQQLSQQLGAPVGGEQDMAAIVTSVINDRLKNVAQSNPLITIILFFSLIILVSRIFLPLLAIPILSLIAIIIYLAKKAHLIKQISVSQPVDRLQL